MTTSRKQCQICKKRKGVHELLPGGMVRSGVLAEIQKSHSDWNSDQYICLPCLNRFRTQHIQTLLADERGELTDLEKEVLHAMREHEVLAQDVNVQFDQQQLLGDRIADRAAEFGGSWKFLGIFAAIIFIWIGFNSILIWRRPFDPYPTFF